MIPRNPTKLMQTIPRAASRKFSDEIFKIEKSEGLERNDGAGYFGLFNTYAQTLKTLNFGQGFPDFPPPDFVLKSLRDVCSKEEAAFHQYTRPLGLPALNAEVAKDFSARLNKELHPDKHIQIANGGAGVFWNFLNACLKPGDEIVTFEPGYVYNLNSFDILGLKVKYVPLYRDGDYMVFDRKVFEETLSDSTKLVLINTPHNPTSKVFSRDELEFIAEVVKKYPRLMVASDEVYYHLTFESKGKKAEHVSIASLPGMFERTITMMSFGKTFSCTGWRLGVGIGPSAMIKYMNNYQTFANFCVNVPAMKAAATCYKVAREPYEGFSDYYEWSRADFQSRKDRIVSKLRDKWGFDIIEPEGGYFCLADISKSADGLDAKYFFKDQKVPDEHKDWKYSTALSEIPKGATYSLDFAFSIMLSLEKGITVWPLGGFYDNIIAGRDPRHWKGTSMIRFSLCKSDKVIDSL